MRILSKEELAAWLETLADEQRLVGPRKVGRQTLYQPVEDPAQIDWGYTRPDLSLKEAFFPPTERLFRIRRQGQQVQLEETLPARQRVIFGARPCDVRGVLALDALFIDNKPVDPYYQRRREDTTLVGLACRETGETCFCERVGGGPQDPRGMDVMLRAADGGYETMVLSEKGRALLADFGLEIDIADPPPEAEPLSFEATDWASAYNDPFWMAMSERCLSCRACAYVCPTCRCFDVRDEAVPSGNGEAAFERLRAWDSCARDAYRRIAGGHNPRAGQGERLRNRFLCKFNYYPQQYRAPIACTGCGRCIETCPVGIDITEVLDHLLEVSP